LIFTQVPKELSHGIFEIYADELTKALLMYAWFRYKRNHARSATLYYKQGSL